MMRSHDCDAFTPHFLAHNEGKLTSDEREEYETSIRFANYLALLQAKARKLLKARERT